MITTNRKCSECSGEMLLSHVEGKDGKVTMYYACVNPNCREHGKAYAATGEETKSMIKERA